MPVHWKVALVEDDTKLARAVSALLRREGYRVRAARSAAGGLDILREWSPDLVLLDLMLPDNQGPELFGRYRAATTAGLVGMTARSSLGDVVTGLRTGADDYVTKPFSEDELLARIGSVLRRRHGSGGDVISHGDVKVNLDDATVWRGRRRIALTGIEYRMLVALLRRPGRLIPQRELAGSVWGNDEGVGKNTIEVHVGHLRHKLEEGGEARILHTVRGMGYLLRSGGKQQR
jgi:two-component system response regulator MprA